MLPPPDKAPPGDGSVSSDEYKAAFGRNLRAARRRLGITQAELAGRFGASGSYIAKVEAGTENLTIETMNRLAHLVGARVPDLIDPAFDSSS